LTLPDLGETSIFGSINAQPNTNPPAPGWWTQHTTRSPPAVRFVVSIVAVSFSPEYLVLGLLVGAAVFMLAAYVRNRVVLKKDG
jgi:hypothetical protein